MVTPGGPQRSFLLHFTRTGPGATELNFLEIVGLRTKLGVHEQYVYNMDWSPWSKSPLDLWLSKREKYSSREDSCSRSSSTGLRSGRLAALLAYTPAATRIRVAARPPQVFAVGRLAARPCPPRSLPRLHTCRNTTQQFLMAQTWREGGRR
jgi:hypothetical protein